MPLMTGMVAAPARVVVSNAIKGSRYVTAARYRSGSARTSHLSALLSTKPWIGWLRCGKGQIVVLSNPSYLVLKAIYSSDTISYSERHGGTSLWQAYPTGSGPKLFPDLAKVTRLWIWQSMPSVLSLTQS